MTTSDPAFIADARLAKPSARRYYIWQAAMWITIVHAATVGTLTAVAVGFGSETGGVPIWYLLHGPDPVHLRLARFMSEWPYPPILAEFLLAPFAVIACYRASLGKRVWAWLMVYCLPAAASLAMLFGSMATLAYTHHSVTILHLLTPRFVFTYFHDNWLTPGLLECLTVFLPLPVTILAALLTIERRKRPPAAEAGA